MTSKLFNQLAITIFFIFLIAPTVGRIFGINSRTDNTEYRRLLTAPVIKDTPLYRIPKNITDYFNDDFGLRNIFIKFYGSIKLNIFNTHPTWGAILGKKGWIFMNPVVFPTVDKWHLHADFTEDELSQIARYLENEYDWLKERGIPYIVVIVPYKEHIYPEYYPYPDNIVSKPQLVHFLKFTQTHTKLQILDLRDPLIRAKSIYPVYYHTDSHWNQWGAYVGYQEIGKVLTRQNPYFHTFQPDEFNITPQYYQHWVGDLVRTSAIWKDQVPDVNVKLQLKPEYANKYPKLRTAFVYGDSFAKTQHFASKEDFLNNFPQLKDRLDLIFTSPFDGPELKIKLPIDDLIPELKKAIPDKNLVKRVERYIVNFRLQDDELLGINYFLNLNFKMIHFEQTQHPLEKELIEKERPQVVVREVIEQVLYSSFDELLKSNHQGKK